MNSDDVYDIQSHFGEEATPGAVVPELSRRVSFVDAEVSADNLTVKDIGAVRWDGSCFHSQSRAELSDFLKGSDFICGHNIVCHDIPLLFGPDAPCAAIDTLPISPILFPEREHHNLAKAYKSDKDEINNPVDDCKNTCALLHDELRQWDKLPKARRLIFATLLWGHKLFDGFLKICGAERTDDVASLIRSEFRGVICTNADIEGMTANTPCELAYSLSMIGAGERRRVMQPWVLYTFPRVEHVVCALRHTRCATGCQYCNDFMDIHKGLKQYFGYDDFRLYDGEPLQARAVQAAVDGKSLIVIFPTGGGKSLTFQLPALMAGRAYGGLTVVISPLQSLMKDQVDNLENRNISGAVAINGLLDPIARSQAIKSVEEGDASILYIAPESLRSRNIERMLCQRHIVRFVIDEAHCFSSWGQDFRIDYLYIGKFIKRLQELKGSSDPIPVSCFTATAKPKVVQDIRDYFRDNLNLDLVPFASKAQRKNLRYTVLHAENDEDKYTELRSLIEAQQCPTIVYVSRTKRTIQLAQRLTRDGFPALPFNGKMPTEDKVKNQNAFMQDEVKIIVATSAFGMGVDKKDVGLVIHHDISDSLENYVQEAGRAGRDPNIEAKCYVLYSDNDLDKHFTFLTQSKLSHSAIQSVWKAIKEMTKTRTRVFCSALDIARAAGLDEKLGGTETTVKAAISALEEAGFVERGHNMPQIYATSIRVKNMEEARTRITNSKLFDDDKAREQAARIIKSLITSKYTYINRGAEAESRIDYLSDVLGISRAETISAVSVMKLEGILGDARDMTAFSDNDWTLAHKSVLTLERFARLELFIINFFASQKSFASYKALNAKAQDEKIKSSEKDIKTIAYFLVLRKYAERNPEADGGADTLALNILTDVERATSRLRKRVDICRFAIDWFAREAKQMPDGVADGGKKNGISFSFIEMLAQYNANRGKDLFASAYDQADATIDEAEEALLYLTKIGALKLEGGFLVIYNKLELNRIKDRKFSYNKADYRQLDDFYKTRINQIHIVGKYANLMVSDYNAALQYVNDYFNLDYRAFISKYFKGDEAQSININATPKRYAEITGGMSARQKEILSDKDTRCIVVAAGPGSGKTRLLVHKLASLMTLEEVKHEQLLMLTFSRAAATEFKQRLLSLIGNAAHFVDIKTFHSYCFDVLGKFGDLEGAKSVVARAVEGILTGEVEPNKIAKSVLVIDEAQDMDANEFQLVEALMSKNEDMRVIAVGDDDQNIYEFRGSSSEHMCSLGTAVGAKIVEMTDNYRSSKDVVEFANAFATKITERMKKNPIVAMRPDKGEVRVVRHSVGLPGKENMLYAPLVADIKANIGQGSTCVLTQTNDEAATVSALLRREGIASQLIQSLDSFKVYDLAEVRYFVKQFANHKSPVVDDNDWDDAIEKTKSKYDGSHALPYLLRCLEVFDGTYREKEGKRYLSDLTNFLRESDVEDFCETQNAKVVVSTIHKAKGREFDDVYMLVRSPNESNLRSLYVGITRAKNRLSIHTCSPLFDGLPACSYACDQTIYPSPDEVVIQLSHKHVRLDFFLKDGIKMRVLGLKPGDMLRYEENSHFLSIPGDANAVCELSKRAIESINDWERKGYAVSSASIRFIVAWVKREQGNPHPPGKDAEPCAVILPEVVLRRR